ncbi:hypothetical protein Glaag_4441 (plasmid) [Glaciecola sp. 4H-3-7+YE-5]|nr:hypothetical protein Glaag_4441 [Glaciecola sp. 4H-3-7+YE-5]
MEIVELSKALGMQIFQHQDASHLESKGKIQQMMQQPQAMQ